MPAHSGYASTGSWYLIRLAPGAEDPLRLTSLPIKPLANVYSVALSGSGRELAITQSASLSGKQATSIEIYSVATGRLVRDWTTADPSTLRFVVEDDLTWTDNDRAIAFPIVSRPEKIPGGYTLDAVRRVDVTAPSGDLIANSRVIWSAAAARAVGPLSCDGDPYPLISADGKTITCTSATAVSGSSRSKARLWRLAWLTYPTSAQPGRNDGGATIDYQTTLATTGETTAAPALLWANTTGSTLLGMWLVAVPPRYPPDGVPHFGVIEHGTFTPLPLPAAVLTELQQIFPTW
jgi:hypothetical protein